MHRFIDTNVHSFILAYLQAQAFRCSHGTDIMGDSPLAARPSVHRVPLPFFVRPPACCICGVHYASEWIGVVCDSGRCWWPLPYRSRFYSGGRAGAIREIILHEFSTHPQNPMISSDSSNSLLRVLCHAGDAAASVRAKPFWQRCAEG